ncbi:MAG: leucine-rich repeat protein [Tannerellaceae bacterium]|nr:leucine-rich repeat protein [Tannerellaceae bacterium]
MTSYQQEDRVYKYSIQYSEITTSGDVVLATQEDVDNFAATGVRKIYGNLTVGTDAESSPVENLDGLAQLEEVTGTVRILGSYTGSDLSGLKNLQIAGNIIMGELQTVSLNTSLQTIVLPALKEIKGDFFVHSEVVEKLEFESLLSVGGAFFFKSGRINDIVIPSLRFIGDDLIVSGTNGENTIEYFYAPALVTLGGSFSISEIPSLTGIGFTGLQTAGDISFTNLPLLSGIVMNQLESVNNITVKECTVIQSINFPSLYSCGTIDLYVFKSLYNIVFDELVECRGDIIMNSIPALKDLSGFGKLERIAGELNLYNLVLIKNLEGMAALKSVPVVTLGFLSNLEELDLSGIEMNSLTMTYSKSPAVIKGPDVFNGSISITYYSNYGGEMSTFEGFRIFNGSLTLTNIVTRLRDVLSLPELEYITNLTLTNSTYLEEINAPKLKEIGETLSIMGGKMLVDFPALERVGDQLSIFTVTNMRGVHFPELVSVGSLSCGLGAYDVEFPKLQEVNGDISFYVSSATTSKSIQSPSLKSVSGNLKIGLDGSNNTIEDLNFGSLNKVQGNIVIQWLSALYNYSTFSEVIKNLSESQWSVTGCGYNPTWQQMKDGDHTGSTGL